jgi:hypothetical protein
VLLVHKDNTTETALKAFVHWGKVKTQTSHNNTLVPQATRAGSVPSVHWLLVLKGACCKL